MKNSDTEMLIHAKDSFLLVIDVQDRLAAQIHGMAPVVENIVRLIKSARVLQIPVLCTEHCPQKIGPTLDALMDFISDESIITKSHFSACLEPGIEAIFSGLNRKQAIVTGVETHVCVLQTALLLRQAGYRPYLVADGTSSRQLANKELAVARMRQNAVEIVSTEMVIFEWLQRADRDSFPEILPIIRDGA